MSWDWSRVNPKGGLSANVARALAGCQVLVGVGSLLAAADSNGPWMWLCVVMTVSTWSLAAVITAIAAGWLNRP